MTNVNVTLDLAEIAGEIAKTVTQAIAREHRIRFHAQENAFRILVNLLVKTDSLTREDIEYNVETVLKSIAEMKNEDDYYKTNVASAFSDLFQLFPDRSGSLEPAEWRPTFQVIDGDLK
jgi:hypothetical protein